MSKSTVVEFKDRETIIDPLSEMLKAGAKQLIHQAVEAELAELLSEHVHRKTKDGRSAVIRNGYQPERDILTGVTSHPTH